MNIRILPALAGAFFPALVTPALSDIEWMARPPTAPGNSHYIGNRAPLQPSSFIKLPPGAVRPEGWIREVLVRQRNGLAGHLHEVSNYLNKENNAWLSSDGEGENKFEEVPYWLKGFASMGYILGDDAVIKEARTWIEGALASQREDGYFGPWFDRAGLPDLWGNMIMLWCLQSYYEHSGDGRVLGLMKNYFQWQLRQPEDKFLKTSRPWEKLRAGDNLYSVYWLYNIIGEKWLLDLAEKIHRSAANWRLESDLPIWHNVDIAQGFREPAIWWMQSGETPDLRATYNNFWLIRRAFGQVPGGMFGGDEHSRIGHIDPRQAAETCGMVEQMASDELLLRITGDPMWAENCEDVAFNTYPAAFMPDYKALRYFTAPNQIIGDKVTHHPAIHSVEAKRSGYFLYNPTAHRCCQHNHTQGWPYYAGHLWLATADNGLAAVLFGASSVRAKVVDGVEVLITERTAYPFEEQVSFEIGVPRKTDFPLYVRIPAWCDGASIAVNGVGEKTGLAAGGYVRIRREWADGDRVTLKLPMRLQARQWDVNQRSLSINYGPLTFSLKIAENYNKIDSMSVAKSEKNRIQKQVDWSRWPAWELKPGSAWNYALACDMRNLESSFQVVKRPWPEDNYPWTHESTPVEIRAKGARVSDWTPTATGFCPVLPLYPAKTDGRLENITLIPMGAARLRISAFPPLVVE